MDYDALFITFCFLAMIGYWWWIKTMEKWL
jgi:hypothetical protein